MGQPELTAVTGHAYDDGSRRTEILHTTAELIATSLGVRQAQLHVRDTLLRGVTAQQH